MATLEVFVAAGVTWLLIRLMSGRATIAFATFFRVFLFGLVASTVVAIVAERVAESITANWSALAVGAIEEVAKALPLIVVFVTLTTWRRLAIADWLLVGLAGALGFTVAEWDLYMIAGSHIYADGGYLNTGFWPPYASHLFLFGSLSAPAAFNGHTIYFAGAATTAFVGLAIGVALRVSGRRWIGATAGLVALAIVAIDGGMWHYEVGALTSDQAANAPLGGVIGAIYTGLLDGHLELWLFIGGAVIAGVAEGRWASRAYRRDRLVLAEEATSPLVVVEWLVVLHRLFEGWCTFERYSRFFRHRRAYGVVFAEAIRTPDDHNLVAIGAHLRRQLDLEILELGVTPAYRWLPPQGMRWTVFRSWVRSPALAAVGLVAFVVFLVVPPTLWPSGLASIVYSSWLSLVVAIVALVLGLSHLPATVLSSTRPTPTTGTELRLARDLSGAVVVSAIVVAVLAVVAHFFSVTQLIPNYGQEGVMLQPFEQWVDAAGAPANFLAGVALLLAALPVVARPLAALERETTTGEAALAAGGDVLEAQVQRGMLLVAFRQLLAGEMERPRSRPIAAGTGEV